MDVEKVGKAIAYLRKRAGFTQKDLADRIGISDKAVSKWERGLGLPDITYIGKLAILLDTDTDSLLTGDVIHHDKGWAGLLILDYNPYCINASTIIYDKPLVYYLLSYYLLVGIKKIVVVCGVKDQDYLVSEFGDGSKLGISLLYCVRDGKGMETGATARAAFGTFSAWKSTKANGLPADIADALDCSNVMVVFGRSLIYGVDQTRFFQRAMVHKSRLTILSLPKKVSDGSRKLMFDDNRKIVDSYNDEKLRTQYDYYEIPVLFCPRKMLDSVYSEQARFAGVDPHTGGGFVGSVINLSNPALRNELLYTEVLDRGYVEMSVDTPDDVSDVSNYVRMVQKACGMTIYCIEEIAWRRGMISIEKLEKIGQEKADTDYGKYILGLCRKY